MEGKDKKAILSKAVKHEMGETAAEEKVEEGALKGYKKLKK